MASDYQNISDRVSGESLIETEETIKILDKIGVRGTSSIIPDKYWWIRVAPIGQLATIRVVCRDGMFGFSDNRGFMDDERNGFEMLEALAEYPIIARKLAEPIDENEM